MSAGDYLIVALLALGFFWIVGKLFVKAVKFLLIAAIGAALVAAFVLGPVWILFGIGLAAYGLTTRARTKKARLAAAEPETAEIEP